MTFDKSGPFPSNLEAEESFSHRVTSQTPLGDKQDEKVCMVASLSSLRWKKCPDHVRTKKGLYPRNTRIVFTTHTHSG